MEDRGIGLNHLVLDMDSSQSPTYGSQEGSAYNGYFGCTCYHPLAEVAVPKPLFAAILGRIQQLAPAPT